MIPSQAALAHLRTIKPNDGWAVQREESSSSSSSNKGVRLLRRNVPLTDTFFLDIHYCPVKNVVVGILSSDGKTCQVLVDEDGKPVTAVRVVSVSSYDPRQKMSTPTPASSRGSTSFPATRNRAVPPPPTDPLIPTLTAEQNKQLVQYGLMVIGTLMVLKILANANLAGLYLLALPLLYFYAVQNCPSMESFDAKKELKRVLRGHHLPEDDPNKPKGFFEELAARVTATVTAEIATFPGYEVDMTSLGGAAWMAGVRIPTAKVQCYWIGAFHKWYYITSFEIPDQPRPSVNS